MYKNEVLPKDSFIPKIIHFCWFGPKKFNQNDHPFFKTWTDIFVGYKFILWNEENCNIYSNKYVHEAYLHRKFAFVSDYFRLKALYDYGGIYLDVDVEILKNFDPFMNHDAFICFQQKGVLNTGTIGAKKNNYWIKYLLQEYDSKVFINEDGSMNTTPNTHIITKSTEKLYGLDLNGNKMYYLGHVTIYPVDYFCSKNWITGRIQITKNSSSIHHFEGSWIDKNRLKTQRTKYYLKSFILLFLNEKDFIKIKKFFYTFLKKS